MFITGVVIPRCKTGETDYIYTEEHKQKSWYKSKCWFADHNTIRWYIDEKTKLPNKYQLNNIRCEYRRCKDCKMWWYAWFFIPENLPKPTDRIGEYV